MDGLISKAYELCDKNEYDTAKVLFEQVLKDNPKDYEANLGMVRCLTHDYTKEKVNEDFEYYFQKALLKAPLADRKKLVKEYNYYINNLEISAKMDRVLEKPKKGKFKNNFYTFLISFSLIVGIFVISMGSVIPGIIAILVGIFVGVYWYLTSLKK